MRTTEASTALPQFRVVPSAVRAESISWCQIIVHRLL